MQKPTESELNILHVLWVDGPCTVREVNDALNQRNSKPVEIGYTTTLKFMQIMHEKGFVEREEDGRTHRYTAIVSEQDTKGVLLQNFVDTAFRGSAMDMLLQALGNHSASADELDQIKALIADMEQKSKQ